MKDKSMRFVTKSWLLGLFPQSDFTRKLCHSANVWTLLDIIRRRTLDVVFNFHTKQNVIREKTQLSVNVKLRTSMVTDNPCQSQEVPYSFPTVVIILCFQCWASCLRAQSVNKGLSASIYFPCEIAGRRYSIWICFCFCTTILHVVMLPEIFNKKTILLQESSFTWVHKAKCHN